MTATLSNVAATLNLSLMQGKFWSTKLTLSTSAGVPLDVTGFAFRGHIRQSPSGVLVAAFTFTIEDAVNGVVRVELSSAEAAALSVSRYMYDWEYEDTAGEEHALVRGSVAVITEVTHD